MRICSQTANIHAIASIESETTSQALLGESVKVLKVASNWSQIELQVDGYKGFVENRHLVDDSTISTHRVINKLTPLFDQPDIKSPVKQLAVLASELTLYECEKEQFWRTEQHHFVWKQHTRTIDKTNDGQFVNTAQSLFSGSPYLWGGRSPLGLDCSAVVQLTALLHGWHLPRDTSDQVALFRSNLEDDGQLTAGSNSSSGNSQCNQQLSKAHPVEYSNRQTNDLVYWPGHVAIVLNADTVVHATAHSLQCCSEPLNLVEARAGRPESIWRLTR